MKRKILLDTDIGNDIDDTLALTYLLCQPECDLLGVTTCTGFPEQRAQLADSVIRYFGRDIPVFPGAENPILTPQRQPLCPQYAIIDALPYAASFKQHYAVEFMREVIEQYPGEVTVVGIGPATNLGLLFATYPHLAPMVQAVSQMLGYYTFSAPGVENCVSEWNVICDAHAAQICYQAALPRHMLFGLDVTMRVILSEKETRERFTAKAFGPINAYHDLWWRRVPNRRGMIFHDPLACAALFDETLCTYKRGEVSVDLKSDIRYAATILKTSDDGTREAAVTVDSERFFEHFFNVVESGM